MTVTIPTGDLIGLIKDVIAFASPVADLPLYHCVRLEWDGKMLHAMASDGVHLAWSQWSPGDDVEGQHQESLFTAWGGKDVLPWAATISLQHAKDLTTIFKLGKKEWYTPLELAIVDGSVQVARQLESGYSALIADIPDTAVEFVDFREVLSKHDVVQPVSGLRFNAEALADFARVRPRGPMEMRFTGQEGLVLVTIGERFVGAIQPIREFGPSHPDRAASDTAPREPGDGDDDA